MRALLVADAQIGITQSFDFCKPALPVLAQVTAEARSNGTPLVFAVAALRPSGADLSPNNHLMGQFFAMGDNFHQGLPGTVVDPLMEPTPQDTVVVKRRASAFHASDLDMVLRSQGIDELTIAGFATGAVVLATALAGLDRDYRISIVEDACADPDPAVHAFLTTTYFPSRGVRVLTSTTWTG